MQKSPQQSCAVFLNFNNSKNYWRYGVDFLLAGIYLLKLQIDDAISRECDQASPAIKTLRSQKLKEV